MRQPSSARDHGSNRAARRRSTAARAPLAIVLASFALLLSFAGADAAKRLTPPISLSAAASVAPTVQFLGDATGTVFTFTVRNTSTGPGALSIGAVEIARPSTAWTVVACPSAPAGWSTQRSDNFCRYRSASGTTDDIAPGESDSFQLRATTASGTQDRAGTWALRASRSDSFSRSSMIGPLRGEPPGLTITAHSFEILDAVVGTGTIGAACPSATEGNHSAITGSSQTILICGRNRMTIAATPTAGSSSIGGEFIGAPGAFSSDSIPANSGNVILASWTGATITSTTGPDLAIQARIGSSSSRTSPLTQLDDDCSSVAGWCIDNGGYEALNQPPTAQDTSASALEDQSSAPITLTASDGDGQPVTFAVTDPAHGTLDTLTPAATCDAGVPSTCTASVVYTPDPDYNGLDSFTFTATDPFAATSAPATVSITVTAVNDAPSFTKGADETVLEDAGAQSVSNWATAISAGPANESGQTVGFTVTGNTNPGLFSAGPVVSPTGTLTYTPAADANGSTTVTLAIADNGGTANGGLDTSPTQQFTITVTAVNDAPSFTKGPDQTVLEDAGAQSVSSWATAISAGPADEAGQAVSFTVTDNTNPSLFASGPAIAPDGTLTYTPAANANGSATVTLKVVDDGAPPAESPTQQFTITVTAVNDAPSFTKGADETVLEDAGAQSVSSWATAISAGPANESGQTVGFTVTGNTNPGLFSAGPVVSPAGTLTYTPAPNANGAATITLAISDNGGTANGGLDTSPTQQFTITVTAVNDAPSFTAGADQTVLEDAGAQSVSSWATAISAGPADEAGQAVGFTVTANTNPSLFAVVPAIAPDGTLTYTPAANANGSATVTLKVVDDGAPPAESPTQQFTITVTAVNDAPSFDLPASPDQSVEQDSGAQSVTGFATTISAGPADESGQTLTFTVTNGNNSLFSAQPDIDEVTGDLTYTPAAGATGTATVSVFLSDDGGTADGGDDTSATQTFDITVVPPNATPVAQGQTGGSAVAATEDLVKTITLTATDADGDALTLSIVGNPTQGTLGNFGAMSCAGNPSTCTQTVDYTPFANQHGPDSFTFKANDGTIDSSTVTVEIVVAAVNDPPTSPGRAYGASSLQANMQRSIAAGDGLLVGAADAADIAGDAGYTPALTIGDVDGVAPVGGTITAPVAGVGTVVANAATGAFTLDPAPGITGDVSFGYTVCDTGDGTPATECTSVTASFNIAGPVIWFVDPSAATNGSGTLASPFNVLASADAADAANHRIFVYSGATTTGLSLNSGEWLIGQAATGSFDSLFAITPPAGTITRPTLGAGTVTIGGTVTLASNARVQGVALSSGASTGLNDPAGAIIGVAVSETSVATTTGTGVNLSNITGTVSITSLTTSGGAGVSLTGANNGATFSFAGVSVSSGANAAFTATGGGTVDVTGAANTLTTTTGTALNVANTTIGASGLTFRSIASNGAASGIVLNNTGSSGGLTVTGTGAAGSGGTIQGSSGPGVSLTSTRSVSLSSMTISNGLDDGIRGSSVTGLSIANSTVSNNGDAVTERGIEVTNLLGTASITDSTLTSSAEDNLYILNDVATALSLTVSGGTISETDAVTGNDGILVIANGPSNVTASVTGVSFSNQRGDHIQVTTDAVSAATVNVTIDGNTLTSTNPALVLGGGITVNPSGTASVTATIRNHATFTGSVTSAISIASSLSSTVRATIANNAIGSVSVNGSGSSQGNGIYVSRTNTSSIFTSITDNQINQWTNLSGIDLNAGDGTGGGLHATITGNTLSNPATGPFPLHGVHLNSGTTTGNDQVNCLDLRTNTLAGSGAAANGGFDVRLRQRFLTTVRLPGYAGANNDNAAVAAFVQANNTGSPSVSASNTVAGGGGGFINAACTLP